jgi:uncharacterized small protein (DUF1192 family)
MDGTNQVLAAERLHTDAETIRQHQESLRQAQEQSRANAEEARVVAEEGRLAVAKEVNGTVAMLTALLERMEAVETMRRTSRSAGE